MRMIYTSAQRPESGAREYAALSWNRHCCFFVYDTPSTPPHQIPEHHTITSLKVVWPPLRSSSMPLNTLRLNHQQSDHPNDRIIFIKTLQRPVLQKAESDRAELVLKAIAAQCFPIMKGHYLQVTTLEEYEPNPEFIGRNFNNGEIIQLVIKSKSGAWLPLNMIQMVMMHELAHNSHMNHGKDFWKTRNTYAEEMRKLWSKGYTGDGLWGRGYTLSSLQDAVGGNLAQAQELADLPLCGGTYRTRTKKQKAKANDLTWKEKRDKRIEKKFGKNGNSLGEDEDAKLRLQILSKVKGASVSKPRVAQSKRGRELRAAAALARFDTNKKEVADVDAALKVNDEEMETESEYEEADGSEEDARDHKGNKLHDMEGHSVVRVCEEEDADDAEVKNEMEELANLESSQVHDENYIDPTKAFSQDIDNSSPVPASVASGTDLEDLRAGHPVEPPPNDTEAQPEGLHYERSDTEPIPDEELEEIKKQYQRDAQLARIAANLHTRIQSTMDQTTDIHCPMCSMSNDNLRGTCMACAHVLDPHKDPRHWRCTSEACTAIDYINAGDCGVCNICGARRPTEAVSNTEVLQPLVVPSFRMTDA